MSMKLLVRFGDKIIAGLILLFVLYQLVLGLQRWMAEPELTESVKKAIQRSEKSSPKPKVEALEFSLYDDLQEKLKWDENLIKEPKRPLRYKSVVIDVTVLQKEYQKLRDDHEHLFVETDDGAGKKHCAFPGCPEQVAPPPVYIGAPIELALGAVGVMSVEFTWKEPSEFKDAAVQYCVVQRTVVEKDTEDEALVWSDVLDEEGAIKKIFGGSPVQESEEGDESSGFVLPEDVAVEESLEEKVVTEDKVYSFLDFNLDPSSEYAYRIRAIGESLPPREKLVIEGEWSGVIRAMTKEDQGVGFVRYLPGLRDAEGNYKMGSNGEPMSPDKVYVRVRKLFDPPWSNQRYFVEYLHRNIVPGKDGLAAVGKMDPRYRVKTEDGNKVYIDKKEENFLFVSEDRTVAQLDAEVAANKKNWKEYKLAQDFTTPWVAVEVIEEVVEEMDKVTKYNAQGESTVVTSEDKIYRYFLVLKGSEGNLERLELEREAEDLNKRLRTD